MALYGRTDAQANVDKVAATVGNGAGSVTETIVFVDEQEAQLTENKNRGINGPGWWAYHTYSQGGVARHKARMLCFLTNPDLNANETQNDDAIAADRSVIISAQPASQVVVPGAPATFAVSAATDPTGGSITAQWQVSTNGGTNFTNISSGQPTTFGGTYQYQGAGFSGQELYITATNAAMVNYQYRVILSTAGDSGDVTSDAATLTF